MLNKNRFKAFEKIFYDFWQNQLQAKVNSKIAVVFIQQCHCHCESAQLFGSSCRTLAEQIL